MTLIGVFITQVSDILTCSRLRNVLKIEIDEMDLIGQFFVIALRKRGFKREDDTDWGILSWTRMG